MDECARIAIKKSATKRAKEIAKEDDMKLIDERIKDWDEEIERLTSILSEAQYEVDNAKSYKALFLEAKKIKLNTPKARIKS